MGRIKVVNLISGLNTGGAETALYKLISTIDKNLFNPVVISMMDEGTIGIKLKEAGIPVYTLNMKRGMFSFRSFLKLIKILRQEKPDILQTWMYHADFVGALIKIMFPKTKLVWNIRHSYFYKGIDKKSTIIIAKICAKLSYFSYVDCIICCSQAAYNSHTEYGYCKKKMIVIPNGFNLEKYKPSRDERIKILNELGLPTSSFIIGHVGRFHPLKNHEYIITACKKIEEKYKNVHFILCGKDVDTNNRKLMNWIQQKGTKNIHLLGQRNDIFRVMNCFDLFILPSKSEGFPNVLGEAMACEVPCIVTNVGDSADIVADTGFSIPINEEELVKAIKKFIKLPEEEKRRMGKEARIRVIEEFDLIKIVKKYEDLYKNLIKKG
ncbi:glycosyltransferase [Aeribacillus pallidus]|nr:glycosyltransferase [Aeribacillus pallidus]